MHPQRTFGSRWCIFCVAVNLLDYMESQVSICYGAHSLQFTYSQGIDLDSTQHSPTMEWEPYKSKIGQGKYKQDKVETLFYKVFGKDKTVFSFLDYKLVITPTPAFELTTHWIGGTSIFWMDPTRC